MNPTPDPLDHAIKVVTLIGAIGGFVIFLITLAAIFIGWGVLKKTLTGLVDDMREVKAEVKELTAFKNREEGRHDAESHVAQIPPAPVVHYVREARGAKR